ncbi:TadE/TadG family type IV pilus assembly protein [Croceicoccus mobilis]|uniref:Putative Flp pilus-assembly TadG-like N-terminal domain-containing protein n=1 Tax=Croceicoccus mobilis TaxID=1703339 RepID=A0A917DPR9_9SPHN|nr:pilus assembly protein TadG-related protein [Croceicoccus mobilis]GGD57366.1 hypothetical protein GCM10010990_03260 [Croceicoccus mobilis]
MRGKLRTFGKDQNGAVAGIYAVALIGLIAIGGVGFDYARMAGMDSELQNAADQAALAAATQLDGELTACARADKAAVSLLDNITLLSNVAPDDGSLARNAVTVNSGNAADGDEEDYCGNRGYITFYSSYSNPASNTLAGNDADAAIVAVSVDSRTARYAFTPIVGAIFARMSARAVASIGSAICDVPPLMICDPQPDSTLPITQRLLPGYGIQVTGHGNNTTKTGGQPDPYDTSTQVSSWAPGDFGFLEIGTGQVQDLIRALAYDDLPFDCSPVGGTSPETGNAQGLYDAINTRFDIYDFQQTTNGNNPLAACNSGGCPSASNTVKDLIRDSNGTTSANACKLNKNGWYLPPNEEQFWPIASTTTYNDMNVYNDTSNTPSITAMGLPRDNCHYESYRGNTGTDCGSANDDDNRVGNGVWGRGDYWATNHPGVTPPAGAKTMTRYQTYLWELGVTGSLPTAGKQVASPLCSTAKNSGISNSTPERRVLTVAVVTNCSSLSGKSTPVEIGEWMDMFLVEPIVDDRENGSVKDGLYMEVINVNQLGSGSTTGGTVRKDKPFLIE